MDKYGDSSKLVNRLGITEEEITEVVVLAPWWHPNKLYNKYDCKVELLSDEFPDVHRITYNNKSFLLAKKECVALLVVSDNTVQNESLISGRTEEDIKKYHHIGNSIIPNIIFSLMLE